MKKPVGAKTARIAAAILAVEIIALVVRKVSRGRIGMGKCGYII